jgi:hypothetical protein
MASTSVKAEGSGGNGEGEGERNGNGKRGADAPIDEKVTTGKQTKLLNKNENTKTRNAWCGCPLHLRKYSCGHALCPFPEQICRCKRQIGALCCTAPKCVNK